jgi:hypothetical protein
VISKKKRLTNSSGNEADKTKGRHAAQSIVSLFFHQTPYLLKIRFTILDFKLAKNIAYNYNPFFHNLALKWKTGAYPCSWIAPDRKSVLFRIGYI